MHTHKCTHTGACTHTYTHRSGSSILNFGGQQPAHPRAGEILLINYSWGTIFHISGRFLLCNFAAHLYQSVSECLPLTRQLLACYREGIPCINCRKWLWLCCIFRGSLPSLFNFRGVGCPPCCRHLHTCTHTYLDIAEYIHNDDVLWNLERKVHYGSTQQSTQDTSHAALDTQIQLLFLCKQRHVQWNEQKCTKLRKNLKLLKCPPH